MLLHEEAKSEVRVMQNMHKYREAVVRCAVGAMDGLKVEVGLHRGSALSSSLTDEVRQEVLWTVICGESRGGSDRNRIHVCESEGDRWKGVSVLTDN